MNARLAVWSGPLLILGGVLYLAATVLDPDLFDPYSFVNPLEGPDHVLYASADVLFVVGLPGLWIAQADRMSNAGTLGFMLLLATNALSTGLAMITAFAIPAAVSVFGTGGSVNSLEPGQPLAGLAVPVVLVALTFLPGSVMFGIASARAGIMPKGCGWLLGIGALLTLGGLAPAGRPVAIAGALLLCAAWCGFGYSLTWRGRARRGASTS